MIKIIHQIFTENQYRVASGVAVGCAIGAWLGHITPGVFIGALVAWMTWKILTR